MVLLPNMLGYMKAVVQVSVSMKTALFKLLEVKSLAESVYCVAVLATNTAVVLTPTSL